MQHDATRVLSPDDLYLVAEALHNTRGLEDICTSLVDERLIAFRRLSVQGAWLEAEITIPMEGEVRLIAAVGRTLRFQESHPIQDLDSLIAEAQYFLGAYLDTAAEAGAR